MWITQHVVARTFVWLAAMVIPVQGLPSVACGCTRVTPAIGAAVPSQACCSATYQPTPTRCPCTGAKICRCGKSSSCKRQVHTCCSARPEQHSCCSVGSCSCSDEGTCSCGANCQCGKKSTPPKPVAPPAENNSTERIVADSTALASLATIYQPCPTRQDLDVSAGTGALTSLDRCITLCRFTI